MSATGWTVVEAVGTSGALLVSAFAFLRQSRDSRRAQAARVSATFAEKRADVVGHAISVEVRNGSDQPVYDVFPIVADNAADFMMISEAGKPLAGHDSRTMTVQQVSGLDGSQWHRVGVQFMDSNNRHWTRLPNGRLFDRTAAVRLMRWAGTGTGPWHRHPLRNGAWALARWRTRRHRW